MKQMTGMGFLGLVLGAAGLASCGGDCESFVEEGLNPTATTTSNINLRFDDDTPYTFEDVLVFVNGLPVGVTDGGGKLDHTFAQNGVYEIRALHKGTSQGIVNHNTVTGGSAIFVPMTGDLSRPSRLTIPQVQQSYVPRSSTTTLDLGIAGASGVPVDMDSFVVVVRDAKSSAFGIKDVSNLFEIDGPGSLELLDTNALFDAMEEFVNDVAISVRAFDTDGARVASASNFFFGQHTLDLSLEAPPSNLGLQVNALEVRARLIGTDLSFTETTDELGSVSFTDLPTGTYEVLVEANNDGEFYTAAHVLPLAGDSTVGLVVLGLQDVLDGVSVVASLKTSTPHNTNALRALDSVLRRPSPMGLSTGGSVAAPGGGIQVSGGLEDEVVVEFAEVALTPGTTSLGLSYEVVSEEYPDFVSKQSALSDTWSVRVYEDSGKLLFSSSRDVNSQLRVAPMWIPGTNPGSTGMVVEEVKLGGFGREGGAVVYLVITSTNIGDDLNPTSVTANLGASQLLLKAVAVDAVTPDFSCGIHSQVQGKRSDQFSLPYEGEVNHVQRKLIVDVIGRPDQVSIARVTVDVVTPGTTDVLARVLDAAPSAGGRVQHHVSVDGVDQLYLTVTSDAANPSTIIDKGVPPLDRFEYLITLTAGETDALAGSKGAYETSLVSPVLQALWKANLDARTGCREVGGDDWAARQTVQWLNANLDVIPAVDDICGEHNRNLGHLDHETAKGIDIRQFPSQVLDLPSGLKNYIALRDDVRQAIAGDATAIARVDDWFTSNRNGFAGIAAVGGATRIYIAESIEEETLPANWFYELFTQGSISNGKQDLDLPSGPWTHPYVGRVRAESGHLDYYHVKLF